METYILITERAFVIPGDERSRTHPGHGYPEHTERFNDAEIYNHFPELEKRLKELIEQKRPFKVFSATQLNVKVSTDIQLQDMKL